MLIRFSVENFRSFNERQVFSMAAGKQTRHKTHLLDINGKRLLKSGVVFGANASGKSNLIKAISFGKQIALQGVNAGILVNEHYRIDSSALFRPGIFQYDFVSNNHLYSYGIAISYVEKEIVGEWLYLLDNDKEVCIFERSKEEGIVTDIKFKNEKMEQRFNIYSEDVPSNKTFLSAITEQNIDDYEDFAPYFDTVKWFSKIIVIHPESKSARVDQITQVRNVETYSNLMKYFDTGIEEVAGLEKPVEEVLLFLPEREKNTIENLLQVALFIKGKNDNTKNISNLVEMNLLGKRFNFSLKDGKIFATQLLMNHGNNLDLFDFADESDGTKRLFDLIPLYQKSKEGYVIFIDELDRSFHTKLTIEFIEKFFEKSEGYNSQLIVTLHDSNVMDLDLLRQDEIWFVERQNDHSSKLYSFNKFKERFDRKIAKEYLLGRYGAIPCFGQSVLFDDEEDGE